MNPTTSITRRHRLTALLGFLAVALLMSLFTRPAIADGPPSSAGLREAVDASLASLTPEERAALPRFDKELSSLRATRPGDSAHAPANAIGGVVAALPGARQDEFGVRTEPDLGSPDCPAADAGDAYCAPDEWLATRSQNFVNISKRAYMSPTLEFPQGVRVNASFVAEKADTIVAAYFSAEAYLEDDVAGSGRRMFIRALLDGTPMAPGDAVFATTDHQGVRQFIFTAKVPKGIHTVEIQWMVDTDTTGYLRDTNLLVRTGRSVPANAGTLVALTPKSGASLEKTKANWEDIPGTSGWVYSPADGVATVSFSAESKAIDGAISLRAVIDGAVAAPSDVVFARGSEWQSRGFSFGKSQLTQGWHSVRMQWFVEEGATGFLGDRSTVAGAYPNPTATPTHPFVSPPSGPNVVWPITGLAFVPGMTTTVNIPAKGNGELAVMFGAEVVSPTTAYAVLVVDGAFQLDSLVLLTDGTIEGQVKSYVLEAKHLSAGAHTLEVWIGGTQNQTEIGDRSMAVLYETGYVPDLAEAPALTGGRITSDFVGGIEPLIGPHKVLAVLFDPRECDDLPVPGTDEDPCVDGDDLPYEKVESTLFGPANENINGYFQNMSGGRFSIVNAGVNDWYKSTHPSTYYWDKSWKTCDYNASGFSSGHVARRADALLAADADVDFSTFDTNGDGRLTSHELAIVVVIPQANGDGSALGVMLSTQCPGSEPMVLDGVTLPDHVAEWFTSLDPASETYQFSTGAHELLHQFSGLDDLYIDADHAAFSRELSLMSSNRSTSTHLDPIQKLALGWVTPKLVDDDAPLSLTYVEQSNQVVVLPRYNSIAGEEYYVLENRRSDAGAGRYDDGIADSGIAVWHAVVDPVQAAKHPVGVTQAFWDTTAASTDNPGDGTMGRWGIRLIRAFQSINFDGTAIFANKNNTLWDNTSYDLVSGACPAVFAGPAFAAQNVLAWADCTASGYGIDFTSGVANTMSFAVSVN